MSSKTFFSGAYASMLPLFAYQEIKKERSLVCLSSELPIILGFLKNHIGFQYHLLSCVSGVDFLGEKFRFMVSYDLLSVVFNARLRLKLFVNELTTVPSSVSVYPNANWWEREIWDLFGIFFEGHPDLRRILTDYGFEGYPLRKDFPLYGFSEVRYDESIKRVVMEPLEFSQEYRSFDIESAW